MNDTLIMTITLVSVFLVVYHHLFYPLILRAAYKYRKRIRNTPARRNYTDSQDDQRLPTVTIVVPAYNEELWIAEKIRNLAILDYPKDRFRIIIACDGCSDDTAAIAAQTATEAECRDLNLKIRNFRDNRGKVAVINDVLSTIDSELVALSDVSSLVSIDALLIAAEHFRNPQVGVLNGHYQLLSPGSAGEETYWRYQCRIKAGEAALGSTLGAHGAFYLFRRSLFRPLAADTINDDFILPMEIVASGFRADYEQRISVLELEQSNDTMDQQRRRRIAAGNLQQLLRLKRLLLPSHGNVAFIFASGKALRVLMPFLMLTALIGSLLLATHPLFSVLAAAQGLAYGLAGWYLLAKPIHRNRYLKALAYLVAGHLAGLTGAIRYLFGFERGHWKRVDSNQSH